MAKFYTESPQEALDTVLQAYLTAETIGLPAMVILKRSTLLIV